MLLTNQEQNQLSRRIIYFYHRILIDVRCWLYEGEIDKARDVADYLEPMALDFFNNWQDVNKEIIQKEIHAMIDVFIAKHGMRQYYYDIFDLPYEEFVKKYLSLPHLKNGGAHEQN